MYKVARPLTCLGRRFLPQNRNQSPGLSKKTKKKTCKSSNSF